MRMRWLIAAAALLLAATGGPAAAQGRGRGRGQDKPQNRGQAKKAEREAEARFGDRDREVARNWYVHERRGGEQEGEGREGPPGLRGRELPPGLRDRDRLPPGLEGRLRPGFIFEPAMRRDLHPVPVVLVRAFVPPPPGYQYFLFGGHVVLVDPGYRLFDVIHLEINIGR